MNDYEELQARLTEAEETLNAIRSGAVDALVVAGPNGDQVYTLEGADHTYRRLVEEMREGAVVLTTDGDILYCNRCFAELMGLPLESLIGSSMFQFIPERDGHAIEALLANAVASGESGQRRLDTGAVARVELLLNTGNGDTVPVYLSATGLELADATAICLIVTDLSDQKRTQQMMAANKKQLEEEQLKANKLESLGILAGGLAHDLNNSLTAVLGNISLAKRSPISDEGVLRRLDEAEMACLQARDVTERLLTFAKGGVPIKEVTSIAQLLKEWGAFALSGSNVHCDFDLDRNLRPVELDRAQMSRVINNLLINAQQAMPEGGTITIRARNVTLGQGRRDNGIPLPPGNYVRIDVQDTGTGIPEPHLARIFDPYFTTKQKGSGLGLSIAYSVVKSHSGYLNVESQAGTGTTFRIYLPATNEVPTEDARVPEVARQGKMKVLVLDDQAAIREVIRDILVKLADSEVEFADDGLVAIELYKQAKDKGKPFDVVLMDLTIPGGMGGKEAIKKLIEFDPDAKAVVVSGYSNDPIMSRYQDHGFKAVIRKPFDVDVLLDTLHAVTASSE